MNKNTMRRKVWAAIILIFCCIGSVTSQTKWVNPLELNGAMVHGRWWHQELKSNYHRMPDRAEKVVRKAVWDLSKQSAGLSLVFHTNAPSIKVRYTVTGGLNMFHMPTTGVSGLDLYATDADGGLRWCASKFNCSFGDTIHYEFKDITYFTGDNRGYDYELYLPLYNEVTWLEIGVPEDRDIRFSPASSEKPIVVYGTSIAQGACASRTGMAWTNIVERETTYPLINLAFSGNGQMEEEVFNLLAEIDAKLYIIDCLPNLTGEKHQLVYDRLLKGIEILRANHNCPILLVEHNYANKRSSQIANDLFGNTNKELRRAYEALLAKGVKDIYYLSNEELGFSQDSMVEGIHPNDIGMREYANAYIKKINEIFLEVGFEKECIFKPCTQQRDWYDWRGRHELMLKRNREEAPQIVLIGNSITHFWTDDARKSEKQAKANRKSWDKLFKGLIVHNQGFGWDRIENGLWRIAHGELDGFDAEKIFLLLGTNNFYSNTPEEIADGMMLLIKAVKKHQPHAKIYQVGVMPRRDGEEKIKAINELVKKRLEGTDVTYVEMSTGFLDENGKLIESLFAGDGLHPNEKGYAVEAKNLEKYVKE